ncbi:MAG: Rrf2 family transcriptional regulator [Clostridiales bacterium]|nr:Rrf2 family transcriptional regulator [Clostridiales bacterium]
MKISTKGRYGLKAVFEIAQSYGQAPVSVRAISEKHEISEQYLEQLFKKLRSAGIVRSIRGAQGGYELTRPPKEITVGQVLRAMEGTVAPVSCAEADANCAYAQSCVENYVYRKIRQAIDEVVDHLTLFDMIEEQNKILHNRRGEQ